MGNFLGRKVRRIICDLVFSSGATGWLPKSCPYLSIATDRVDPNQTRFLRDPRAHDRRRLSVPSRPVPSRPVPLARPDRNLAAAPDGAEGEWSHIPHKCPHFAPRRFRGLYLVRTWGRKSSCGTRDATAQRTQSYQRLNGWFQHGKNGAKLGKNVAKWGLVG